MKKSIQKLRLGKETLAYLDVKALFAAGGATNTCTSTPQTIHCTETCARYTCSVTFEPQ